jgi:hypothetical protein
MPELVIIVPTRSRPEAVERVVEAWRVTGAFDEGAELLFVVDRDDPRYMDYREELRVATLRMPRGTVVYADAWQPLVPKLNRVAVSLAVGRYAPFIGFAGDDHLPRTPGWAGCYIGELYRLGTGIVSCADGYREDELPTQWAMTANIVRALGRMVPAPVEHLYCDNAVKELGEAADCFSYLPDVMIEHMHPVAGKAPTDEQYQRVNSRQQYRGDRKAYHDWLRDGLQADAETVRQLIREGIPT